jgi:hypothetical protein
VVEATTPVPAPEPAVEQPSNAAAPLQQLDPAKKSGGSELGVVVAGLAVVAVVAVLLWALRRWRRENRVAPDVIAVDGVQSKYLDLDVESRAATVGTVHEDDIERSNTDSSADAVDNLDSSVASGQAELQPIGTANLQAQTEDESSSAVPLFQDFGPLPQQGGLHSMHKARRTATGVEVAAKHFDKSDVAATAAFHREWKNLRELMADRGGQEYVTQLVDVDERAQVLYLELALGSLDQQLEEQPEGFVDAEIRLKIARTLNILNYLHMSKLMAHNDIKVRLNPNLCAGSRLLPLHSNH